MSSMGCLMSAFNMLTQLSNKYRKIAADAETKAKTMYFGIYSIVTAIISCAFFVLGIWGLTVCIDILNGNDLSALLIWVLIVIIALMELVIFAQYIFGGLLGVIYQFRCNRRPIGFIALAVFIAATVGMIVGIIFIVGSV